MPKDEAKGYVPIRVALVSPSDVPEERKLAKQIVDDINRHLAIPLGMFIDLRRWEDASPGLHELGPQGQIDSYLNIAECDYVVGVFWNRVGTATAFGPTGAEHEILTAHEAWEKSQRPQLQLYFNKQPYTFWTVDETEQRAKVLRLQDKFRGTALYKEYDGPDLFAEAFRNHLTRLIADRVNARSSTIEVVPCFVSTVATYIRVEGMAEVIAEMALLFATAPGTKTISCKVVVTLNVNITNTITEDNLLVDVYLSATDASSGAITRFRGKQIGMNQAQFENVEIDLAGPIGTREYVIAGLRANPAQLVPGGSLRDRQITAWIQVETSTEQLIHVVNPLVSVGIAKSGPYFILREPVATFSMLTGANSSFAIGQSGARPEVSFRVRFEERYLNEFTNAAEEARYKFAAEFSPSPTGIRFLVRFSSLPSNIRLYVTTRDIVTNRLEIESDPTVLSAVLIRANDIGAGAAKPIPADVKTSEGFSIARIDVVNGLAYATWEWLLSNAKSFVLVQRWVEFGVVVVAAPNEASIGQAMVVGCFAPLYRANTQPIFPITSSTDAPVPRFANARGPLAAFNIVE